MARSAALPFPPSGPVRLMLNPILSGSCAAAESEAKRTSAAARANSRSMMSLLLQPGAVSFLDGCIDDVHGPGAREHPAHFRRRPRLQSAHRLLAVPGDVRLEDHVLPPAERMGVGERLRIDRVEGAARDPSLVERADQRGRRDDGPPRAVHDVSGPLHLAKLGFADEHARLWRQRQMQRDEIRLPQQRLQIGAFDLQIGIEPEDPHSKCARAQRDLLPDAPEPHDPEGAARETKDGLSRRDRPPSRAHHPVEEHDFARAGEEERHGVIGNLLDAVGGVVRHDDARRGGGVEVDRVHADPVASDDLAPWHLRHHLARDGPGIRVEERVAIAGFGEELIGLLRLQGDEIRDPFQRLSVPRPASPTRSPSGPPSLWKARGLLCQRAMPRTPSTSISTPSGMRKVASGAPRTMGILRSRASEARCEVLPPSSVTTAAPVGSTWLKPGPATRVTRTSPGATRPSSHSQRTTQARPEARPTPAGWPRTVRPAGAGAGSGSTICAVSSTSGRAWTSWKPASPRTHSISMGCPKTASARRRRPKSSRASAGSRHAARAGAALRGACAQPGLSACPGWESITASPSRRYRSGTTSPCAIAEPPPGVAVRRGFPVGVRLSPPPAARAATKGWTSTAIAVREGSIPRVARYRSARTDQSAAQQARMAVR